MKGLYYRLWRISYFLERRIEHLTDWLGDKVHAHDSNETRRPCYHWMSFYTGELVSSFKEVLKISLRSFFRNDWVSRPNFAERLKFVTKWRYSYKGY